MYPRARKGAGDEEDDDDEEEEGEEEKRERNEGVERREVRERSSKNRKG